MTNGHIGIIGLIIAGFLFLAFYPGLTGSVHAFTFAKQNTTNNTMSTWKCSLWQQTTQADFQSGIAVNVSTTATPNSVILGNQTTFPSVYGMHGNTGTAFSLYNISNNTWVSRAVTPATVLAGGALAYTGNGNISAFRGTGFTTFWTYNISTDAWSTAAAVANNLATGASLTYTGNGNISAFDGSTRSLRYNISTNTWVIMANPVPANVNAGGALTYTGNGNISAWRGGGTTTFWSYNISTDAWTVKAVPPATVNTGGALAYSGNGNVSALRGNAQTAFWQYNISTNTWSTKASAPVAVGTGGALAYTQDGNVSAFAGGGTTTFWRYNLSANATTTLPNAPSAVGAGGSLAYVPANPSVYTYAGTLASVVNDSGKPGTKWYNIFWSGTTNPGVTNITFQVRASDISFLPGAAAPSWVTVSWPSPVTTGLPSGEFFQWQAILTTKDPGQSPVLNDVSLCYA
jgi:hypothetical protein